MGDDVPYRHPNGLLEIPIQWVLEDGEQFAFNAEPAWGVIPETCDKVFTLWLREFEAAYQFGTCMSLILHPWLSGHPARLQLLERLVRTMQDHPGVWFATGSQIAEWFDQNPDARREVDLK